MMRIGLSESPDFKLESVICILSFELTFDEEVYH
jgi:hypothetical protein